MSSRLELLPFSDAVSFAAYQTRQCERFARDKALVEQIPFETALAAATKQLAGLLPQGAHTSGHSFRRAIVEGREVGQVWYYCDQDRREGFVYDLFVEEHSRRQGHGREILAAVESDLQENACRQVWLNVFGHNAGALEFYRTVGYQVGTIHMTRLLGE